MKHAGAQALTELASCLSQLRALPGLVERRPGCFYRRSQAWLHFHEDPAGLFADVRLDSQEFSRLEVTSAAGQDQLLAAVRAALVDPPG